MNDSFLQTESFRETVALVDVQGQSIKAIVTTPADGSKSLGGIVFSHGWSGFRSGPSGILADYAREFARLGYASIRCDFRGRGESDGDGLHATLATMSEDLVATSQFFQRRYQIDTPIYCGICSGGNVIIGSLPRLPHPRGLLLLSVYPFSDGDAFSRDVHRTFHFLSVYAHKLMKRETWSRFLAGDVSLRNVLKVLLAPLMNRNKNRKKEGAPAKDSASKPTALPKAVKAATVESRSQAKEPPKKFLANLPPDLPGTMVYGSGDPDATAAMAYYGNYINDHQLPLTMHLIPDANHNFSNPTWRRQALSYLIEAIKTMKTHSKNGVQA